MSGFSEPSISVPCSYCGRYQVHTEDCYVKVLERELRIAKTAWQTEETMHLAWRKRAEEAEAREASRNVEDANKVPAHSDAWLSPENRQSMKSGSAALSGKHIDQLLAHCAEMDKREAELIAERNRMREVLSMLLRYREHTKSCEIHQTDYCNCGMALVAAKAREALAATAPAVKDSPKESQAIEHERELIAEWLWKYANEDKWRYSDTTDEIRHFVGHAMDYIKGGWYMESAATAPATGLSTPEPMKEATPAEERK